MRRLILLAMMSAAAAAHADPVGYFGNTLQIARHGALAGTVVYRPDHTYLMITSTGVHAPGRWHVADTKLCLQPNDASLKDLTLCVPDDPTHKVGESWWVPSPAGGQEQLTLVAGVK